MSNARVCIVLFIILVLAILYIDIRFNNFCTEIVDTCTEMENNLSSANMDILYDESMEIFELIQEHNSISSIYINHTDYDAILIEALKLSVYLERGAENEAEVALHLLRYNAEHMKNLHIPNIENIF